MISNPLLTIIIAAHNCEKTIEQTFQSLLNALGSEVIHSEIIIIDDASEDGTADKVSKLAQIYPQVIVSKVNYKNIGQVRQHGISLSHGEYITMLDSDDLLKNETLSSIMSFLNSERPDMFLTRLHEIRDLNKIDHYWSGLNPEKISRCETIRRFLIHKDLQAHLIGQFIKRKIYLQHSIPSMTCYEDFYVFPSMIMKAESIYYQYDSHYYYIKNQGSLSSALNPEKIKNLIDCTLKMESVFPTKFKSLILCHWLDIFIKHGSLIKNERDKLTVQKHIKQTFSPLFFFNPNVRLSYKRKALSILWKK
ncbi:MAG TPA: glycosyltransferase family 2 protein [Buttiauxella sp.]|jgi:glycosyltransferase involved in cell wall biosynthesis